MAHLHPIRRFLIKLLRAELKIHTVELPITIKRPGTFLVRPNGILYTEPYCTTHGLGHYGFFCTG